MQIPQDQKRPRDAWFSHRGFLDFASNKGIPFVAVGEEAKRLNQLHYTYEYGIEVALQRPFSAEEMRRLSGLGFEKDGNNFINKTVKIPLVLLVGDRTYGIDTQHLLEKSADGHVWTNDNYDKHAYPIKIPDMSHLIVMEYKKMVGNPIFEPVASDFFLSIINNKYQRAYYFERPMVFLEDNRKMLGTYLRTDELADFSRFILRVFS